LQFLRKKLRAFFCFVFFSSKRKDQLQKKGPQKKTKKTYPFLLKTLDTTQKRRERKRKVKKI
jgi:hypothetical protein